MNAQEYISSGIIENYVLGLASPEEQQEFERLCRQYPELVQARIAFEISLEEQAQQQAVAPPAALRQSVLNALTGTGAKSVSAHVTPVIKTNWLKYAVAACLVLLAGSLYWNISLYNQNRQLQSNYEGTAARMERIDSTIQKLHDPNVKMAAMKGLETSPASFATVYWDSTSKDVYLMVNNLPTPASDKQYQLWALLDGKPVDVGMIPNEFFAGQKQLLLHMKNVQGAQAFAITLEQKGGNPTPKGTMYVLGNL